MTGFPVRPARDVLRWGAAPSPPGFPVMAPGPAQSTEFRVVRAVGAGGPGTGPGHHWQAGGRVRA
jgi:hypothetical protein